MQNPMCMYLHMEYCRVYIYIYGRSMGGYHIYIYIYVCIYVYLHIYLLMYMFICIYACMYVCMYVYIYIHMHMHISTCVCTYDMSSTTHFIPKRVYTSVYLVYCNVSLTAISNIIFLVQLPNMKRRTTYLTTGCAVPMNRKSTGC